MDDTDTPAQTTPQDGDADVAVKKPPARRPGRPPKKKVSDIQVATHGIVNEPTDPNNVVEMVYENPKMFKKLFGLYKQYEIREIVWHFYKDRIEINLLDYKKKTHVFTTIYGRMLIRYYCKEDIVRCINRQSVDKVFKTIGKDHTRISLIVQEETSRSKMYFVVRNSAVDVDQTYGLGLINQPEVPPLPDFDDATYPIKFELPSKHFKDVISEIIGSSDIATVERNVEPETMEDGTEQDVSHIVITYESNKKMNMAGNYRNPSKIKLIDILPPDDIFAVSFYITYIRPFSHANIGDTVKIAVDKHKHISLSSDIDNKKYTRADGSIVEGPVCTIKIYSEIKKYV